jgi:putative transposase
MIDLFNYYQIEKTISFSRYSELIKTRTENGQLLNGTKLVGIIAYCLMPTHFHIILNELNENGLSLFIKNILNSYTRYFNIKHNRKGPLWESRSKKVSIESDEQLLHLTRYIHLNPVTSYLVKMPEDWPYSSYKEYIFKALINKQICTYKNYLDIKPHIYAKFVEDGILYQREMAKVKQLPE